MHKLLKQISIALMVTMIMTLMPTRAFGEQQKDDNVTPSISTDTKKPEGKIVGEVKEKRERNVKCFKLDDGSFEADVYKEPIHYYEDGQWKDIDNTFQEEEDSSINQDDNEETQSNDLSVSNVYDSKNESKVKDNKNTSDTKKKATKVKDETKVLKNKSNDVKIKVAKNSKSKKLVQIKKDKYEIDWNIDGVKNKKCSVVENKDEATPVSNSSKKESKEKLEVQKENDEKKTLKNICSTVKFSSIFNNVDLEYSLIGESVKENIILNKPVKNNEFTYNLKAKNLTPVLQKDNTIIFYDKDDPKKAVFNFKAPFMIDAKNNVNTNVKLEIKNSKSGYQIVMTLDKEWINSSDRAFPVKIDPDLTTDPGINGIYDTFVCSNDTENKYQNILNRVGSTPSVGKTRTYIKFLLPQLTTGDMITGAQLNLQAIADSGFSTCNGQVNVHRITQNFNTQNINWNTQPQYDSTISDYYLMHSSSSGYWASWDVTSMVKDWYNSGNNYGLMLEEDSDGGYQSFWSSDRLENPEARPSICMHYVNNTGLESYWTYHSQDVKRAGTGYVNDYNGNMIFIHDDLSMNGNKMPITLKHVYNSNDRLISKLDEKITTNVPAYYGPGWRLNLSQRIEPIIIEKKQWYRYTDEDGTRHYFYYDSTAGKYIDESGNNLTLQTNYNNGYDNGYCIIDKKDNKLLFTSSGVLYKVRDNNNNEMTLGYNGAILNKITDGAGRVTTLDSTSDGVLIGITDPSGRRTRFAYNGAVLERIIYPDGNITRYEYDSNNNLTKAVNYDGYSMTYSYYNSAPYRVKSVSESNVSTTGEQLSLKYDFNTTTFTDVKGRINTCQFDNCGKTICIKDNDGSASYYKYDDLSNTNKLTTSSKLQKVTKNYIKNHNTEISYKFWDQDYWGNGKATYAFTTEEKYIGNQSLKVSKTDTIGRNFYSQQISLTKGNTYTFSTYVKTSNISNTNGKGALIFINYQDSTGAWKTVDSNCISESNTWQRIETSFTLPADAASNTVFARVGILQETGNAYFDCMQLEDGNIANRYNLVENSDFDFDSGDPLFWTQNSAWQSGDTNVSIDGRNAYRTNGVATLSKNIYQNIQVSGNTDDVFVLGGWAKGLSVPLSSGRYFGLDVGFVDANGKISQWEDVEFNSSCPDWQYASKKLIAKYPYKSIYIYTLYYNNANTAYFDNLQLYKEEFGESYQYDSKGNVKSTQDLAKQNSKFDYDGNNNLITKTDPKGNQFKYTYDNNQNANNHNIKTATTAENVVYSFNYDSSGNPVKASVGDSSNLIESTATYTQDGNYIKSLSDSSGNTINYNYNSVNGNLNSVTDAKGSSSFYSYDDMDRITGVYKNSGDDRIELFPLNGGTSGSKGTAATTDVTSFVNDENGKKVLNATNGNKLLYNLGISRNSGTLTAWFNSKTNDGTVRYLIANQGSGSELLDLYLDGDNCIVVAVRAKDDNWYVLYKTSPVAINNWSFVACSWNYSNNIFNCSLYLNGQKQTYCNPAIDVKDFTGGVTAIGSIKDGSNSFKELIDQFGYCSSELGADTINKVYAAGRDNYLKNTYQYDNDRISKINHNNFNYGFEYDPLGNNTKVNVGNVNLIENSYDLQRGLLTQSKYGNGQIISSDYDNVDRIIAKKYNGNPLFNYQYDASGNLAYKNDLVNGVSYRYIYDCANRLVQTKDSNGNILSYGFDKNNNTSVIFDKINSFGYLTSYGYDNDNKPKQTTYNRYTKTNNGIEYFPLNGDTIGSKGTNLVSGTPTFVNDGDKTVLSANDGKLALYNLGISKNSGTMSIWFKTTTSNNTAKYIIASQGTNSQILHMYIGADSKLKLAVRDNSGTFREIISSTELVNVSQWYFGAFSWLLNGSSLSCTLYLNDKSYTASTSGFKDFTNANTAVGSYVNGKYSLNGCVEQFSYTQNSLNSSDILDIYNNGRGTCESVAYDSIARIKNKNIDTGTYKYPVLFNYVPGINKLTTTKVESIINNGNAINYTYDKNGNIETIKSNGKTIKYYYNELNELIREDNGDLNKTIVYVYDAGDNIVTKTEYSLTTPTTHITDPTVISSAAGKTYNYEYTNPDWKDKLTSFDGKPISYDQIGNPLTYDNWNYTWEQGRQLAAMKGNGQDISYKYDDAGIRTEKTVNGGVTKYHLVGDKVTYEDNGTDKIYYTYDSANDLVSMNLNGVEYYYIRNAQNDIIGLFDKDGTQVVSYSYDSWGKLISIDGSLKDSVGVKNPYRYRGYRFDTETGLYYLNSRYYNPEWGRFINADALAGQVGDLLSHNVFAYSKNDPINYCDPDGFARIRIMDDAGHYCYDYGGKSYSCPSASAKPKSNVLSTIITVGKNICSASADSKIFKDIDYIYPKFKMIGINRDVIRGHALPGGFVKAEGYATGARVLSKAGICGIGLTGLCVWDNYHSGYTKSEAFGRSVIDVACSLALIGLSCTPLGLTGMIIATTVVTITGEAIKYKKYHH